MHAIIRVDVINITSARIKREISHFAFISRREIVLAGTKLVHDVDVASPDAKKTAFCPSMHDALVLLRHKSTDVYMAYGI